MVSQVHIYVEGGGKRDKKSNTAVREGFAGLLRGTCAGGRSPRIVACGGGQQAWDAFKTALADHPDPFAILLVDAEGPVTAQSAKLHLAQRDGWSFVDVDEEQIHLMVQKFEAWVVADADAIAEFYGQGFNAGALPQHAHLEAVSKDDLDDALTRATRGTGRKCYHKIDHGPKIIAKADPSIVRQKCPSCKRLFEVLEGIA